MVVVLDEDSTPPPSSGGRGVVMTPVSESTLAVLMADPSPAAEVPKPSQAAEVLDPFPVAGAVTVEEVMELATSQYIDFPGVGVIDVDAPSSRTRWWTWRRSGCARSRQFWRRLRRSHRHCTNTSVLGALLLPPRWRRRKRSLRSPWPPRSRL
jgi:hypothetical protein